ncbi:MAG: methyltransferase domain-containing protein [Actinophytocola sp.]|uniref:class I SAM-dependent methyltransferase n=1 Tax=Actinophytocola sp. TaxID=1872138 RepID=UPI001320729B|nr:class I SAM-dependent methyltransferase [Actinophytocola sp.]MPZ86393.1 methyltransferase domain-containing protein [Actinophytocola sp.]
MRLREVSAAVETMAIIETAAALDVLGQLTSNPSTAREVATALRLDRVATARLLDALAGMGLLCERSGGVFETDTVATDRVHSLTGLWQALPAVVRTGEPVLQAATAAGATRLYPDVVPVLSEWFAPAAERFAAELSPWTGRVLDVGAGAAPWTIALASRNPEVHVTAVDFPAVLTRTRRAVTAAGLVSRFDYLPGDVLDVALPAHDLAVVGNVCHLFDEAHNRVLLAKLHRTARRVAIVDVLPSADPAVSRYALGLLTRARGGAVHSLTAYQEWARQAGFAGVTTVPLSSDPPLTLLLCA